MTGSKESSFTLIELLIVIAIIAILAAAVILVLNPAQLLAQARDSTRLADVQNLNSSLGQYLADGNSSLGSLNTVYVSVPDTSSTCANLGLPTLPSGLSYHCVASSTLENASGSGWLPVNFSLISSGSPLASLPIDPTNTTSTGLYFTYTPGTGSTWELTALFESAKYQATAQNDGGREPGLYEVGSNLTTAPVGREFALAAAYEFGNSSATAYDASANEYNGTIYDNGVATNLQTNTGCKSGYGCLNLDGTDDYMQAPALGIGAAYSKQPSSVIFWIKPNVDLRSTAQGLLGTAAGICGNLDVYADGAGNIIAASTCYAGTTATISSNWSGQWIQIAVTFGGATNNLKIYVNGQDTGQNCSGSCNVFWGQPGASPKFGYGAGHYLNGLMADVRVYSAELSASEVLSIYNAEK